MKHVNEIAHSAGEVNSGWWEEGGVVGGGGSWMEQRVPGKIQLHTKVDFLLKSADIFAGSGV